MVFFYGVCFLLCCLLLVFFVILLLLRCSRMLPCAGMLACGRMLFFKFREGVAIALVPIRGGHALQLNG